MKTRSSASLGCDRESDSDDSAYDRRLRKRKRISLSRRHDACYGRSLRIGMQIRYSEKNHMPGEMGREHQIGEKIDKKHSPVMSAASHSSSSQPYVNGDQNAAEEKSVRRSTRQRKFMYDNLNQTWLLAPSLPDFSKLESFLTGNERSPGEGGDCVAPRRSERTRNHEVNRLGINSDSMEFDDMYSRVKRERRKSVHDYYAGESPQDGGSMADTEDTDRNGLSDSDTMGDGSDMEGGMLSSCSISRDVTNGMQQDGAPQEGHPVNLNKYSLRPKKPITERFQFPIEPARPRRSASTNLFEAPRHHRRPRDPEGFKNNVHRSSLFRRKRHAIHNSSSSSSDDERHFEKRKARSMARARNRCLPINFLEEELTKGVLRDRMKIGANLADVDPISIDKSISFDSIGGLDRHIKALKEMILFPLMYPEVFEKFKIAPPRGVLFHGQPGTGKTLVARALANECSNNDRHVAFFMRKGADCLSKWVGESERQLRLLFEQAYSMRPSIIFFDEIDGLAPVRSSRQDQIHSSIVSTLLALMDGIDSRGEIVIIGATNRIDAIDPALRRPGRFDREMLFPLPSNEARQTILKIHMQKWNPPQSDSVITELATRSVGYCGADLKALCTEAALVALRRRYPQIYSSRQKLQLDVNSIQVSSKDFLRAMKKMKPSVQRSSVFSAKPLSDVLRPLLENSLQEAIRKIRSVFPISASKSPSARNSRSGNERSNVIFEASSDESDASTAEEPKTSNGPTSERSRFLWPFVHCPRFVLSGEKGQGQGVVAPALLHMLEHIPVHRLDIPSLYAVTTKAPEEACTQIFHEAQRNLPSIIYLPHIGYWWETLSETVRATFLSLLQDLDSSTPVLLLATSDCPFLQLPDEVREIFSLSEDQVMHMKNPDEDSRKKFFFRLKKEVLLPPRKTVLKENVIEALPIAPKPLTRQLTSSELEKLRQKEEATMRELRLFLRDTLNKLARDRRFYIFARPVDPHEVPDYQEVIENPMDLETMMSKIDMHKYETVSQFLSDINLVCQNALEYNPDRDPSDKLIRHRACALRDIAHALVLSELDVEFEKMCHDIHNSRQERGESIQDKLNVIPKPRNQPTGLLMTVEGSIPTANGDTNNLKEESNFSTTDACPKRFSKRIRGLGTLSDIGGNDDDNKKENFPVSNRPSRYIIWRKKKSPWFGSCRRKLIRRTIHNTQDGIPRKKFKKCNKILKFKSPCSLSPIHESNTLHSPRRRGSTSPVKDRSPTVPKSPDKLLKPERSVSLTSPNAKRVSPKIRATINATSPCDDNAVSCDIFVDTLCSKDAKNQTSMSLDLKSPEKEKGKSLNEAIRLLSPIAAGDSTKHTTPERASSPSKQVKVDANALQSTFDRIVKVTDKCTVEMLQHLFSTFHHCIYRHRKEWNKHDLLMELQEETRRFLHRKQS